MERERSCPRVRGGQFNGGRMVLLQRRLVLWRGKSHVREMASLMGLRMVMLQKWLV